MTWASLRHEASTLLPQLAQQLADATWQPGLLREVEIVTYTGKRMPTFVPPVIDRLVHRAMRNTIEPILEAHAFQDWVSGFRPGRSRITALRQAAAHRQDGYRWVADLDVARCRRAPQSMRRAPGTPSTSTTGFRRTSADCFGGARTDHPRLWFGTVADQPAPSSSRQVAECVSGNAVR